MEDDGRAELLKKYNEIKGKYNHCIKKENIPQATIYKRKLRTIRMTLELLNINIDGINK